MYPNKKYNDITKLRHSAARQVTIARVITNFALHQDIAIKGTYGFSLLGADNIPRKPVIVVMYNVTYNPTDKTWTGVSLCRKSIDILL